MLKVKVKIVLLIVGLIKKTSYKKFENMVDNTDMLRDEERITKLIKKAFEYDFKKQEQNLAKIISGNLEITTQEIRNLKNEVNGLKKSMEFM